MNSKPTSTVAKRLALAMFLAASTAASTARAAVTVGAQDNVQIGGFFSQGWINSSGNNYPFEAEGGTFDFREMAVNVSTTFGSHLRVGAQAFAQRLGNYGNDEVKLDWAVADYNFRQEFGVRAGRVKFPKGLYGEALDLDAVRPFVFLPMSLYNPVVRDFNASFDGAMVYGAVEAGAAGSVDYKLFYGDIRMDPEQGVSDFFNTTSIFASPGVDRLGMDEVGGGQLLWSTPISGLKIGYSYSWLGELEASGKLAAAPVFPAALRTDRYEYHTGSIEYLVGDWTFAGEYQRVGGDFEVVNPFSTTATKSESANWYVSAARRLNSRFEVGAYYSSQENSNASATTPKKATYNRDWALALRYDVNDHVLVKIEGHLIDGRYNIFNTVRTPNRTIEDETTFFAAKTTLSF